MGLEAKERTPAEFSGASRTLSERPPLSRTGYPEHVNRCFAYLGIRDYSPHIVKQAAGNLNEGGTTKASRFSSLTDEKRFFMFCACIIHYAVTVVRE